MDEIRRAIARIDENVRLLREDFKPLVDTVNHNSQDIIVLKNDKKWTKTIFTTLIGLIGVILGALAEYFRK